MGFISNLFGKDKTKNFLEACKHGQTENVEKLLKSGKIGVNLQDAYGKTGLICAANSGYRDLVKLFIENGADLNIQDENGETALISAAKIERGDILDLLIKAGANLDIQDENGETALKFAVKVGFRQITGQLIESGANLNFHTYKINTVAFIHNARQAFNIKMAIVRCRFFKTQQVSHATASTAFYAKAKFFFYVKSWFIH